MNIRKANPEDLSAIMDIYHIAQDFMIKNGNPTQWGHEYPSEDLIIKDIDDGLCHLICDGKKIHGVFALFEGVEPTYEYIEDGKWLNDEDYVTVHRIASDGEAHGIFRSAIDYCKSISDNIRIDTHRDNLTMQKLIERNGFEKCGTVYVRDGSSRIAYQWSRH